MQHKMRKTILAAALLAATAVQAQKGLTVLPTVDDPDYGDDYFVPMTISANGKWVGGTTLYGMVATSYNVETGEYTTYELQDDAFGAQINGIDNDGNGAGWDGPATIFYADGTTLALDENTGFQNVSADGQTAVGYIPNKATGQTTPAYWTEAGGFKALTLPTDEEAGFEVNGGQATYISADGSVISGFVIDNLSLYPAIVWTKCDTGYVADFIGRDYFHSSEESTAPYELFFVRGMSSDGQWLGLSLQDADGLGGWGRYNLTTRKLEAWLADGSNDDIPSVTGPNVVSVANDGTLVTYTGYGEGQAVIWMPDTDTPELLAKHFSAVGAFRTLDASGLHAPSGISGDGRYILGYAMSDASYYTYLFDTQAYAAGITAATTTAAAPDRYYNAAGQQLAAPAAGLTVTRHADGTATKTLRR